MGGDPNYLPPEVIFPSTNSQVLRDLLDTDGHQLVHVIKHDEAYGTMVTNVTAIEVQRSGTLWDLEVQGCRKVASPTYKKTGKAGEQWKNPCCFRVCRGYIAQLHRDFIINHHKDSY